MSGFNTGDRVFAYVGDRWRAATVNYRRMLSPTYLDVAAYSVRLDDQLHRPDYVGTVVHAGFVISPEQHAQIEELERVERALNRKGWSMEET
ncbi:MAG: hypothetical protein MUC88_00205 [Planctomycetes bacterium]|nr:hypothetical protein [Planctomycetota bacterium]